jgi:hydrogenase maturation protein HypF
MPGGEAAIRKPWRMAVSHLWKIWGKEFLDWDLAFMRAIPRAHLETIVKMMERSLNSPLTSSCGRLFDAVAAMVGVRNEVTYEAQAAIELEAAIDLDPQDEAYGLALESNGRGWIINPRPMFEQLLADVRKGISPGTISHRFHLGVAEVFRELAQKVHAQTGLKDVCLSGGTFQNRFLATELERRLLGSGFRVFTHSLIPTGDGGLSLGQATIAARGR